MMTRAAKQRTLLHEQERLNRPQFSSFFYSCKIAVVILNIKLNIPVVCCLVDYVTDPLGRGE